MKLINPFTIRNYYGEVLDRLKKKRQTSSLRKKKFMEQILSHAEPSMSDEDPIATLRKLRGYED